MLNDLRLDLRYSLRQLARAPLFTIVASLSTATGVIVAVAAFSGINAVLFKPLPVTNPDGIYHVYTSDGDGTDRPFGATSYADYLDFSRSGAFTGLAAASWRSIPVAVHDAPPSVQYVSFISPNYFTTIGLAPARGRGTSAVNPAEIVLAWPYWQRTFGGDPGVLGQAIRINGVPVTVVGIAPESFRGVGLGPPVVGWASAELLPAVADRGVLERRGSRQFEVVGRLTAGSSAKSAADRLNALAKALQKEDPSSWTDRRNETRLVSVLSHRESLVPPGASTEIALAAAAGAFLVLFIVLLACTNVASLMLGRAVGRHHEVAVRMTLGASPRRLLQQLLTESLLLAMIAETVSLIGLMWAIKLVSRISFADMVDLRPDWRVFLVATITSLCCALFFGLAPALQSLRVDVRSSLTGTAPSSQRNRMRGALITLQVAASCILIMLAFSAVRGVRAYANINPGVSLDGLLGVELDTDIVGGDSLRQAAYVQTVMEVLNSTPGIRSMARTSMLPLGNGRSEAALVLADGSEDAVETNAVGAAFFQTLGVNAERGRAINANDTRTAPPVAVVNRAFLDHYGQNLFGSTVKVADRAGVRIVGVMPDIAFHDPKAKAVPLIYIVEDQIPWPASTQRFLLRVTPGSEATVAKALRDRIRAASPNAIIPRIATMHEHIAQQTLPHRIGGNVALVIGGIELALAAIGLYGLLMFALFARTREIGIRLALGASARDASWAVMRDGLRYAAYGLALGVVLAIPAAIVAQNALPGAHAADPVPFIGTACAVLLVAATAAYMPVRRASRVDLATALRYD